MTISDDSGSLNGTLPAIGTPLNLSFTFPDRFNLGYSLPCPGPSPAGPDSPTADVEVSFDLGGDGESDVTGTGLPILPPWAPPLLALLLAGIGWTALRPKRQRSTSLGSA